MDNFSGSIFQRSGSSYSGCDIIPAVYGYNPSTGGMALHVLGDVQTITYSIHRDKGAVRVLGKSFPKGFTRGQYTIAGSLIFNVFDRRALYDLSNKLDGQISLAAGLPGFDLILYFTNEYGEESTLIIYNIQIMDEGQSHSIEDVYIENTMSYIASDITLLTPKHTPEIPQEATFFSKKRDQVSSSIRTTAPDGTPLIYSVTKT